MNMNTLLGQDWADVKAERVRRQQGGRRQVADGKNREHLLLVGKNFHDGDPGFPVSLHDGVGDGGGASPSR